MRVWFHTHRRLSGAFSMIAALILLAGYMTLKGTAELPAVTASTFSPRVSTPPAEPSCDASELERARALLRVVDGTRGPESAEAADAIDAVLRCVLRAPSESTDADIELAERTLSINERLHGPVSSQSALRHSQTASLYWRRAKYRESFPHLLSALDIHTRLEGPETLEAARATHALAEGHRMLGHFAQAIQLHTRNIALREKLGEPESAIVANSLHYLGVLWWTLGDNARSLPLMERAVAMREKFLGPDDPMVAVSLNMLANQVSHAGDRDKAMQLYQRAQAIWEKSRGPNHPDVARSLSNQGLLLAETGRLDEAAPLLERTLQIRENALGHDSFLAARSLVNLADLRVSQGNLTAAEALLDRAVVIELAHMSEFHRESPSTFADRARVRWAMGKLDAATADSLQAEAVARDIFQRSSPGLTESETLKYEAARTPGLDVALSVAALRADANGPRAVPGARAIWNEVLLSQALVLDLLSATPRPEPDPANQAARVAASLPELSALIVYVRYERHIASRSAETIPSYLAMVLEPRTAGEYAVAPSVISLGPAEPIDRMIQEWRHQVSHDPRLQDESDATRSYSLTGARLREAIWDPISPAIGGAGMVFVVPDGAINLVSLATLPASKDRYLIETEPMIQYLSAARDLVGPHRREAAGSGILVMGGADYENLEQSRPIDHETGEVAEAWSCHPEASEMKFSPLPESLREVQEVASRLSTREEVRVVTGSQASECAFKRLAPGRRIIHLATHGFFFSGGCVPVARGRDQGDTPTFRESPLTLSGLAMAGVNRRRADGSGGDADEGMLMADEIAGMDLSSVEWIVLSGCQTGVGEILNGEGVLGLRRAFQIAGARTLIMSLWPVEDSAARIWMRRLYDNRLAGRSTTASVTDASLDLLSEQRAAGRTTHPYFWGAFVSVGDWK